MRAAALAAAALVALAGGAGAQPAPTAASDGSGFELIVQQGHVSPFVYVKLYHVGDRVQLVTLGGGDTRIWETDDVARGHWVLKRVFPGAPNYRFSDTPLGNFLTVDRGATGPLMFRAGEWDRPLLAPPVLPRRLEPGLWEIPARVGERFFGLVFQNEGKRTLLGTVDGATWAPLVLPGSAPATDNVDLGAGEIAISDGKHWRLYRRDAGAVWSELTLPGAGSIVKLEAWDWRNGIAVEDEQKEKRWYWRDESGRWTRLQDLLPGVPAAIQAVTVLGARHVLGVREKGDADGDGRPFGTRWYLHDDALGWRPLAGAIAGAPSRIAEVKVFAGTRGVAIREEAGAPKGTGLWRYFYRSDARVWTPLERVLPGCPKSIFNVDSFADDAGIGVQDTRDSSGDGQLDEWSWYLRDSQGVWRDLRRVLPDLPKRIDRVQGTSLAEGLFVRDEETDKGRARWRFYLPGSDDRFVDARTLLRGIKEDFVPGELVLAAETILAPGNQGERRAWVRIAAGKWRSLDDVLVERGRTLAVSAAALPASVTTAEDVAHGLLRLSVDDARGRRHRYLTRRPDGEWIDFSTQLLGAPDRITSVSAIDGRRIVVTPIDGAATLTLLEAPDGRWVPLSELIPRAPTKTRAIERFLGLRGVSVQAGGDATDGGTFLAWRFYWRDDGGQWRDLLPLLPGSPPRAQAAYSLADDDVLAIEEEGDANGNGRPDEWFHYLRDGAGWIQLERALPGVPGAVWQLAVFAGGLGISAEEDGDADGDGKPWQWRHWLRDADGRWQPIASRLPGAPTSIAAIDDFWDGRGLHVTATDGASSWYEHVGRGWIALPPPPLPPRRAELRGDTALRLLAARDLGDSRHQWSVVVHDPAGHRWRPLRELAPKAPAVVADVAVDRGRIALLPDGKPASWIWLAPGKRGWTVVGTSARAAWTGRSSTALADGTARFAGATHTLDGARVESVPAPILWLHARRDLAASGRVLHAPSLVPAGVDFVGLGPEGIVLLYRPGAASHAAAFRRGSVERENRPTTGGGRAVFFHDRFADGTGRLHRWDDPTRLVGTYERTSVGRVYHDRAGFFYNDTERVAERMSFRSGDQVFTFDQLATLLFRPDKLEQELGFPVGSLFELSAYDRARLARARSAFSGNHVDVASLKPPALKIGSLPERVESPRIDLDVIARGAGISPERIAIYVEGVGRGRDATAQGVTIDPSRAAPVSELKVARGVALLEGTNHVRITVTDASGLTTTQRRTVEYRPRTQSAHDQWVAIVAASEYRHAPRLPLTQRDAITVAAAFSAQEGKLYGKVHLHRLCDSGCDGVPRRAIILSQLKSFLAQAQDGDNLIVYLSGHGVRLNGTYYFVPVDGDISDPSSLISWDELRATLPADRLARKLVLLDTCHAAAVATDGGRQRMIQEAMDLEGIYVLAASAADASAFESNDLDSGLFTFALKRGLLGEADSTPEDGRVMFDELADYVARTVRELARARRLRQEPQVPIVDNRLDHVVARSPIVRWRLRVEVFKQDAAGIPLEDRDAIAEWQRRLEARIEGLKTIEDSRATSYFLTLVQLPEAGMYAARVEDRAKKIVLSLPRARAEEILTRLAAALPPP